jgi:hypothetical protein
MRVSIGVFDNGIVSVIFGAGYFWWLIQHWPVSTWGWWGSERRHQRSRAAVQRAVPSRPQLLGVLLRMLVLLSPGRVLELQ